MDRKKLELQINEPTKITLLYNTPIVGDGKFGQYYLYAVRSGDTEFSFFAPNAEVHEKLSKLKAGDTAIVTKNVSQKNSKLVTTYDLQIDQVQIPDEQNTREGKITEDEFLYTAMEKSLEQSIRLAKKFNSVPIEKLAISLFIARTKQNFSFSN